MALTHIQLGGLSRNRAELMGKPHIGAIYSGKNYKCLDNARCAVCGAFATNAHHIVHRKTCKTWELKTPMGNFVLTSPLFAVCGSGTSGCHDGFHGGARYEIEWVWETEKAEQDWWSGYTLSSVCPPHSPYLFEQGYYLLRDKKLNIERKLRG